MFTLGGLERGRVTRESSIRDRRPAGAGCVWRNGKRPGCVKGNEGGGKQKEMGLER